MCFWCAPYSPCWLQVDWLADKMKEEDVVPIHRETDPAVIRRELSRCSHGFFVGSIPIMDNYPLGLGFPCQQPLIVVNYDFPKSPRDYIRRLGGDRWMDPKTFLPIHSKHIVVNIVSSGELDSLHDIQRFGGTGSRPVSKPFDEIEQILVAIPFDDY